VRTCVFGAVLAFSLQAPVAWAEPTPRECIAANERGAAKKARGEFTSAREEYLACAVDGCPKIIREECGGLIASLDAVMPTVILVALDARGNDAQGVAVRLDGRAHVAGVDGRAFAVDPGQHVFRFEAGGESREAHVVIREGEKNRTVRVELPAKRPRREPEASTSSAPPQVASADRPVPPLAYVLGAVGLGALGAFTYFGLSGRAQQADLEQRCAPSCRPDEASAMRSKYLAADISLAVAALSLGGATYVYFSRPSATVRGSAGSLPESLASGVELRLTGAF
jgi:hypothetical protein